MFSMMNCMHIAQCFVLVQSIWMANAEYQCNAYAIVTNECNKKFDKSEFFHICFFFFEKHFMRSLFSKNLPNRIFSNKKIIKLKQIVPKSC